MSRSIDDLGADELTTFVFGEARPSTPPARSQTFWTWVLLCVPAALAGAAVLAFGSTPTWWLAGAGLAGLAVVVLGGFNITSLIAAVVTVRASLDWFTAAEAEGGANPQSGLTPAYAAGAAVLVVCGGWLLVMWASGSLRRPSAASLLALAFAAVCVATSLGARDSGTSVATSLRVLVGALLLTTIEQLVIAKPARRALLFGAMGASLVAPAWVGLSQLADRSGGGESIVGTFVHRASFAAYLALLVVTFVPMIRHVHGWARLGAGVVVSVAGLLLVFTYARTSWIAIAAGLLVVAIMQDRWLFALVPLGGAAAWNLAPSIRDKVDELQVDVAVGFGDPSSWSWRVRYWGDLVERWRHQRLSDKAVGDGLGMTEVFNVERLEPHNVWVQVLVETGFLGVLVFTAFVAAVAVALARRVRWASTPLDRAAVAAGVAASMAMLAQTIGQNPLTEAVAWTYFAVPLGIALAQRPSMHRDARFMMHG
jgi:O-antigen ligase